MVGVRCVLLSLVVALAACSQTAPPTEQASPLASAARPAAMPSPPPPSSPPAALPAVPVHTSSPAPAVTPAPGSLTGFGTCGRGPGAPATAACSSRAQVDIDGDMTPDQIVLWGYMAAGMPVFDQVWTAEVHLSSGGRYHTTIVAPFRPSFPLTLLGGADINADGRSELFVTLDHGASTATWLVLVWNGQDLVPAWRDRSLAYLFVNGSVTHGNGFVCRSTADGPPVLTTLGIGNLQSADGTRYTWTEEDLVLEGKVFRLLDSRSGTATRAEVEAGTYARFWGARCGPIFGAH
jgi:hypothetical protein